MLHSVPDVSMYNQLVDNEIRYHVDVVYLDAAVSSVYYVLPEDAQLLRKVKAKAISKGSR